MSLQTLNIFIYYLAKGIFTLCGICFIFAFVGMSPFSKCVFLSLLSFVSLS